MEKFLGETQELLESQGKLSETKLAKALEFMEYTFLHDLLDEMGERKLN
ncbi:MULTISPECIES: hypothetical protein [unclassified Paenibacillus]|nr:MULTISPECIES: hypothetical protein [unclassified Paenibacillus]